MGNNIERGAQEIADDLKAGRVEQVAGRLMSDWNGMSSTDFNDLVTKARQIDGGKHMYIEKDPKNENGPDTEFLVLTDEGLFKSGIDRTKIYVGENYQGPSRPPNWDGFTSNDPKVNNTNIGYQDNPPVERLKNP